MIRAPTVNSRRLCSSFALAKAPKLIFAASCSAAEAIQNPPRLEAALQEGDPLNLCKKQQQTETRTTQIGDADGGREALLCRRFFRGRFRTLLRHLAAGRFDGLHRRSGGRPDGQFELGADLAVAQQAHAVLGAADHAGADQGLGVDGLLGFELAGLDGLLQAPQVHFDQLQREGKIKATQKHAHVQRHLAAFEAQQRHAGTRLLALPAATGGLALARARAAADAHPLLGGAFVVAQFVQLSHGSLSSEINAGAQSHDSAVQKRPLPPRRTGAARCQAISSTTATMWWTLAIMPRTWGVSFRVTWRPTRFRPRPIRVARWSLLRRMGLAVCLMTISAIVLYLSLRWRRAPKRRRCGGR